MKTNTDQEVAVSTWSIDPAHSAVHFRVRHMAIAWVRGDFRVLEGKLHWSEEKITESSVEVDIDASSVNSGEPQRDATLRTPDFLDTDGYPLIRFHSTRILSPAGKTLTVRGELTIRGVTRTVEINVSELSPATRDPWGGLRIAASATAKVSRKDFGLTWNAILETGGLLVGDDVFIELDVEFVKAAG